MPKKSKSNPPPKPPPPAAPVSPVMTLPSHVKEDEAVAEFKRCLKHLPRLTPLDRSLLADYANCYAECISLQTVVEVEGYKLEGTKGGEYINPTMSILMHKQALLAQLRRDLFFTPKSRGEKAKPTGKVATTILDHINNDNAD